jgi:polyhydroxyalkanoate synthesis regulator phasin
VLGGDRQEPHTLGASQGRHFTNDRGENRYYAESEAVREAARERQELARVGNVAEEGEVVRENSRDLAELIMEAVRGNRETVGGEVSRQRVEMLEKLEAMRSERQAQYEELIGMVRSLLEEPAGRQRVAGALPRGHPGVF